MRCRLKTGHGFSLLEVLVVIAILVIMAAVVLGSLSNFRRRDALEKESANLASLLIQARSLTLASKDSYQYGVHLAPAAATLFRGASYDPATTTNQTTNLNSAVAVSSHTLNGGGSDIIFERIIGSTNQAGTITLSLVSDGTMSKVVSVNALGVVEIN